MRAIIGITPSRRENYSEYRLPQRYANAVTAAGGLPVILPFVKEKEIIKDYLDLVDGLLLSGGIDPDPLIFGENPLPGMGEIDPERDQFEIELINGALVRDIPILGICRGCQMINVAAGGTITQDLKTEFQGKVYKHMQDAPDWYPTHYIRIEEKSILNRLLEEGKVKVNSVHHQAVEDVGSDFRITARSDDGVIEAIERKDNSFVLGVQWHPERMYQKDKRFLTLFQELVKWASGGE